jgi:hypothetical protein
LLSEFVASVGFVYIEEEKFKRSWMRIDNILRLIWEFHILFLKVCWWRGIDKSSSLLRTFRCP